MVYLSAQVEGEKDDLKLLLKKSPTGTSPMRVASGTAREALFYSKFSAKLGSIVSKAYWCHADMETGEMAILMECLQDCVPSGVFFGKGNPNNWGISEEKFNELIKGNPSALTITRHAFSFYAKMHATYWNPIELLRDNAFDWLNGHDRINGRGEGKFTEAHAISRNGWDKMLPAITTGDHSWRCPSA